MGEVQHLHFSIVGEFVTNLAREALIYDNNFKRAIDIVKSATANDTLSPDEHFLLCLEIVLGRKKIVGTYPGDDYGVEMDDESIQVDDISAIFDKISTKNKSLEKELNDMYRKFSFICKELSEYKLSELAYEYKAEYGEQLFEKDYGEEVRCIKSNILDDFISHMKEENTQAYQYADYGWLEPDGTYHEVEWGNHSSWAAEYCEEHYPYTDPKFRPMYWREVNGEKQHFVNGDFLMYVLHWVLIDSPFQGHGTPKYDAAFGLTKKQKEFLYDYFIERKRNNEASALYQMDDED
jgi:hypothetical protein